MASPLHRRQKRQTNTSLYFHAPKSTLTSRRSPKSLPPASPSLCSKVCLTSCALSVGREACLLQPVCHSHLHLTVKLTSSTRKSNERQQLSRLNREDLRLQSVWFHRRADFSSPFFEGDSKAKMFFCTNMSPVSSGVSTCYLDEKCNCEQRTKRRTRPVFRHLWRRPFWPLPPSNAMMRATVIRLRIES